MNDQPEPIYVKQILVSLDSSKHSFSGLKAAGELAQHYNAKLKGVFILDKLLLSLAETQFLQEVGEYTAISRKISLEKLTHGMSVQARWINRAFRNLINQTGLDGDFLVLHGNVCEVIEQESESCDLLVFGKSGTHPTRRPRLGSTAKALINSSKKSLLLVEEDTQLGYPMFALFEDSPLGWKSLETARDLLGSGENLNLLLEETNPEDEKGEKEVIRNWAMKREINIAFQSFNGETFGRFLQRINHLKTGLLIIPFEQKTPNMLLIERCFKAIRFPILLVQFSK